jgi:hypothetical protein
VTTPDPSEIEREIREAFALARRRRTRGIALLTVGFVVVALAVAGAVFHSCGQEPDRPEAPPMGQARVVPPRALAKTTRIRLVF